MPNPSKIDREILGITILILVLGACVWAAHMASLNFSQPHAQIALLESTATPAAEKSATPTFSPTPAPAASPEPSQTPGTVALPPVRVWGGGTLGVGIQCWNCAPFQQKVFVSYYDPSQGGPNCFDFDKAKDYCYSPTASRIPYKSVWGFGAACPMDWPYGTWVDIPGVGIFICFDRGGSIVCDPDTSVCVVDILSSFAPAGVGTIITSTLWVPLNPPREK